MGFIFHLVLTLQSNKWKITPNFWGLLRKPQLYRSKFLTLGNFNSIITIVLYFRSQTMIWKLTDTTAIFIHSEPKSTLITAKQFTEDMKKRPKQKILKIHIFRLPIEVPFVLARIIISGKNKNKIASRQLNRILSLHMMYLTCKRPYNLITQHVFKLHLLFLKEISNIIYFPMKLCNAMLHK